MGPLNYENKLQVDKKSNKNLKNLRKILKWNSILNLKTFCFKLTALRKYFQKFRGLLNISAFNAT